MKLTLGSRLIDNLGNIWTAWQKSYHYKTPNKPVFHLMVGSTGMQGTCEEDGSHFIQAHDCNIKTLELYDVSLEHMMGTLKHSMRRAGGASLDVERLKKMTAFELIKLLAPNGIRFHYCQPRATVSFGGHTIPIDSMDLEITHGNDA